MDTLEQKLTDVFQHFDVQEDVPGDLKKEVFHTIETLALFDDVIDLFTSKFVQAKFQLWEGIRNIELGQEDNEATID